VSTIDELLFLILYVLLSLAAAASGNQRNIHLCGNVQELEPHVPPRQGIVVVLRPVAQDGGNPASGRSRNLKPELDPKAFLSNSDQRAPISSDVRTNVHTAAPSRLFSMA
jgi:hypothetical protein